MEETELCDCGKERIPIGGYPSRGGLVHTRMSCWVDSIPKLTPQRQRHPRPINNPALERVLVKVTELHQDALTFAGNQNRVIRGRRKRECYQSGIAVGLRTVIHLIETAAPHE